MSRWISQEAERLAPYTPGEQPQDQQYVKLNTNESPFPPSPKVLKAINRAEILKLNLYSDPTCAALTEAIARRYELKAKNVLAGNGSDEVLSFAFRAFCGAGQPVAFADVTYGFYKSQAALFDLDVKIIPLREDFTLHVDDYMDFPGTIVIANPNAPTGIAVPRNDIQRLLEANPDRVVIVDEAYVDFGAQSAVLLLDADECGNAAHDQQDDECKQQSRHDAGHIDPDIHHRRGAVGAVQLDGLIHQGRCHAAQQRPAHVAHKMLCVHADAEHQQKALQRKLRKVRELTDQMLRQRAEMHLGQRTVDQLHDGLAACGRLGTVFQ